MAVRILQFNESALTPIDDAELYRFLLSNESGIFKGCSVTKGAGNKIKISSGRMVVCGRVIVLEDEEINAKLSPSGTQNGRLILRVDISKDLEEVAQMDTQVSANLPDLVQEDINAGGTVYELLLAVYICNEIDISNLTVNEGVRIETVVDRLNKKVDTIQGKGLSTEDYTTAEKNKLAGIAAGANKYVHPSKHSLDMITETSAKKILTSAERNKLAGIQQGAQVNRAISDSVSSTSSSTAASSKAVKIAYDKGSQGVSIANTKEPSFSKNSGFNLPKSNSVTSSSSSTVATSLAAKTAHDRANVAYAKGNDAYGKVTSGTYVRDRVKTVDGSGSGLDADKVDGKHADELQGAAVGTQVYGKVGFWSYRPGLNAKDPFLSPNTRPYGLAWDGSYLWNADYNSDRIYKLTTSGTVVSSFVSPGSHPTGLTWGGGHLWNVDSNDSKAYKLTTSGTVVSSFETQYDYPRGLAWDGSYLWNVDGYSNVNRIYKLTTSGACVSLFSAPNDYPYGLAWDGSYLWNIDNTSGGKIYKLTTSGTVVSSNACPTSGCAGLTWDGSYIWTSDYRIRQIYKITTGDYTLVAN